MSCRFPPSLSDDMLFDAAVGNASNDTLNHLKDCEYCEERLHEVHQFIQAFEALLPRIDCPSPQKIVEYALTLSDTSNMPDMHSDAEREQIRMHLTECVSCSGELARWQKAEALPDVLDETKPHVKPPQGKGTSQPHQRLELAAQYRGNVPDAASIRYRDGSSDEYFLDILAGNITLFLELRRSTDHWLLTGQLIDHDPTHQWTGAGIELWQDGELVTLEILSEENDFKLNLNTLTPIDLRIHAANQRPLILEGVQLDRLT